MRTRIRRVAIISLTALVYINCSVNTLVADALTGDGSSTVFTGDSDPQLVADALPFAIKMYEALLASTPRHQGLMFITGSLFVMYANAFVQGPAERLPQEEWQLRGTEMLRAKALYLRGIDILYTALDSRYRGFNEAIGQEEALDALLKKCKKKDAGLLYWAVAGGMAAYAIDVFDFDLSLRVPEWNAMIHRAYELDPDFGGAMLDEFLIVFYASLPEIMGGNKEKAQFHFNLAVEKTGGNSAGAYVSYAQSFCTIAQDYETFKDCLEKALAIDPDVDASTRLVTIITQQKARWLLDNAHNYFSFLPIPDNY